MMPSMDEGMFPASTEGIITQKKESEKLCTVDAEPSLSYEGGDSELFNYLRYILQGKCVQNMYNL